MERFGKVSADEARVLADLAECQDERDNLRSAANELAEGLRELLVQARETDNPYRVPALSVYALLTRFDNPDKEER